MFVYKMKMEAVFLELVQGGYGSLCVLPYTHAFAFGTVSSGVRERKWCFDFLEPVLVKF